MQSHRENDAHIRPTRPLRKRSAMITPEQPQTAVLEVFLCACFPRECERFLAVLARFQRVSSLSTEKKMKKMTNFAEIADLIAYLLDF